MGCKTHEEEESFFSALRQVGKNFEKITRHIQSKNKDQVRHYYYRLVRCMNKLLGPELCLDAKNSKDTNAAILRWWSLLEKYSCKASKLHLNPWKFKIFIEALVMSYHVQMDPKGEAAVCDALKLNHGDLPCATNDRRIVVIVGCYRCWSCLATVNIGDGRRDDIYWWRRLKLWVLFPNGGFILMVGCGQLARQKGLSF